MRWLSAASCASPEDLLHLVPRGPDVQPEWQAPAGPHDPDAPHASRGQHVDHEPWIGQSPRGPEDGGIAIARHRARLRLRAEARGSAPPRRRFARTERGAPRCSRRLGRCQLVPPPRPRRSRRRRGRVAGGAPSPSRLHSATGRAAAALTRREMVRCAGAISAFAQLDPERVQQAVARLADDLRSGHWAARHSALREQESLDLGDRLIIAERRAPGPPPGRPGRSRPRADSGASGNHAGRLARRTYAVSAPEGRARTGARGGSHGDAPAASPRPRDGRRE